MNKKQEQEQQKKGEKEATAILLLKILEDILHKRIMKQEKVYKIKSIEENDKLSRD